MDAKRFVANTERDAILIDSIYRALYVMKLTNGASITLAGVTGSLNFEYEIGELRRSLFLLGIDTAEPLPIPHGGRKQ